MTDTKNWSVTYYNEDHEVVTEWLDTEREAWEIAEEVDRLHRHAPNLRSRVNHAARQPQVGAGRPLNNRAFAGAVH